MKETSVTKSPEAVEEIVAEAMSRIRTHFPDRVIHVKVPDELMIVPMDGTLIEQVLINLVENAIKHSRSNTPIELNVKQNGSYAVFEITDHGEGIPNEILPNLFNDCVSLSDTKGDSTRGMGIGLSLCNSIVKAHGGSLRAENQPEGGAKFIFSLPMEEEGGPKQ